MSFNKDALIHKLQEENDELRKERTRYSLTLEQARFLRKEEKEKGMDALIKDALYQFVKFYKEEIDKISKSLDEDNLNDSVDNILNKPMFEADISQENKSFKKDYRLRKDTGDKLSISLKQYKGLTLNLLAMLNDYERENNLY